MTVPKGFLIDQRVIIQELDDREMNSHLWRDVQVAGDLDATEYENMNKAKAWLAEASRPGATYRIARVSDTLTDRVVEVRQFEVVGAPCESAIVTDASEEPAAATPDSVVVARVADGCNEDVEVAQ